MKTLKQILAYLIWIVVSLLLGIGYMRILLGPRGNFKGFWRLLDLFYDIGLICIGGIAGLVISFLFILVDLFYLKKKLKTSVRATLTRFLILIGITVVVAGIHYILEKVIDII